MSKSNNYSELVQLLVQTLQPGWALRIAEHDYGPREPVVDEILKLASSNTSSGISFATREALELTLHSNKMSEKGLLALCYCFRLEHYIVHDDDNHFLSMHSVLYKAIDDAISMGTQVAEVLRNWLADCATRLPKFVDPLDGQHSRSFLLLGILSIDAHLLASKCKSHEQSIRKELSIHYGFYTAHGESPARSFFEIDGYMNQEREWRRFWHQKLSYLAESLRSISKLVPPEDA